MHAYMLLRTAPLRSLAAVFVVATALSSLACGVPPPDRIEIVPPTPIKADEPGMETKLAIEAYRGVASYDDSKAPLVVTWTSSNPAVADVSAAGVVVSRGSGKAQIKASVPGKSGTAVEATVDVNNVMISTVEASGDFPAKFKLSSAPVTLKVLVKDEKGQIIDKPKVTFSASDYCVEASPDGVIRPLAVGECDVIVESGGKRAPKIPLNVLE